MAIVFTPSVGDPFTIGGTAGTGPFPRHSINVDNTFMDDGTLINSKYTVGVTGNIIASGDITVAGERQNSIYGRMVQMLELVNTTGAVYGRLEIVPYGGLANTIDFLDARLINLTLPDQNDESGGIQTQEYTFTFEATHIDDLTIFPYRLSRAEETWELAENDGQFSLSSDDISSAAPLKTFTLTHTVSATGLKKLDSNAQLDADGAAWRQAQLWVISRLQTNPDSVTTDINGDTSTSFLLDYFSKNSTTPPIDISSYGFYNRVRTINSSLIAGSYSVTDTYFVSQSASRHDIEANLEQGEDGITTVTVSGTITGLTENSFTATNMGDKYTNALTSYNNIKDTIQDLADTIYTAADIGGSLRTIAKTNSVGHNKTAGIITWQSSYDDKTVIIPNAIASSLTITDDNEDQTGKLVAVIDIIAKADGPVIQDMGTTQRRSRMIELTATMAKDHRTSKPTGMSYITAYIPSGTVYQQPKKETWQPDTGAYSLSVEWIY